MLSSFQTLLARWLPKSGPASLKYSDAKIERLRTLQQRNSEESHRLAQQQPVWDRLTGRVDPEADIEKRALAPEIVERKKLVERLRGEIAQVQDDIGITTVTAAEYTKRATDVAPWVNAFLAALPTDADLERALKESLWFDRVANDLLRQTGDRHAFRRPIVDPYRALREALDDRLRVIERLRLLRSAATSTKAAS